MKNLTDREVQEVIDRHQAAIDKHLPILMKDMTTLELQKVIDRHQAIIDEYSPILISSVSKGNWKAAKVAGDKVDAAADILDDIGKLLAKREAAQG